MRTVFLVALHYPPFPASSGVQRTVLLAEHLLRNDWRPVILTVELGALDEIDVRFYAAPSAEISVERCPALNASKSFSIFGRYVSWTAWPDRWWTWPLYFRSRLRELAERYRPDVVWSTSPVASAHRVGQIVKRELRIPWVADFRDPLLFSDWPSQRILRALLLRRERAVAVEADRVTFASPSSARLFGERHPAARSKSVVVPNGFDAALLELFAAGAFEPLAPGRVTFLHSGHVYRDIRDPTGLFIALSRLRIIRPDLYACARVVFRASGNEAFVRDLVRRHALDDIVEVLPTIPHLEAIREMRRAEVLLLIQRRMGNMQIPAKLYEYACARRPILGLVESDSDSAATMRALGCPEIVQPDEPAGILEALVRHLTPNATPAQIASAQALTECTRQKSSAQFAAIFGALIARRAEYP